MLLSTGYLPPFLFKSAVFSKILDVDQTEIDNVNEVVQDIVNQCFVATATWGLEYWENLCGIQTDVTKDVTYRRSTILAKLRGVGSVTVQLIKDVASSFANGDVDVIEEAPDYSFTIVFSSMLGIPPNLDDLKHAIEEIKPAHLGVKYKFIYTTHDEMKPVTHDGLHAYTHAQIRVTRFS